MLRTFKNVRKILQLATFIGKIIKEEDYFVKLNVTLKWGVTFHSLLVTRCKITRCSLLVVKSLVIRCKICSLLVAEVARCKKSLVTCCRSCLLQKITRYSLQNSLVTRCRSCSLQKVTRYSLQISLVTRCWSCSLRNSLVTRCKKSFFVKTITRWNCLFKVNKVSWKFYFFQYNLFNKAKKFKVVPSQHITAKALVSKTLSNVTIYKWVKIQQLLTLSQRNE